MKKARGSHDGSSVGAEAEATPMAENEVLQDAEPASGGDHQAAEGKGGHRREAPASRLRAAVAPDRRNQQGQVDKKRRHAHRDSGPVSPPARKHVAASRPRAAAAHGSAREGYPAQVSRPGEGDHETGPGRPGLNAMGR